MDDLLRLWRLPHDGEQQRSVAVPILGSKQILHLALVVQLDEGVDEHLDKVDAGPSDGLVEKPVFVVLLMIVVFYLGYVLVEQPVSLAGHFSRLDGRSALEEELGDGRVAVGAGQVKRRGIVLRGVALSEE